MDDVDLVSAAFTFRRTWLDHAARTPSLRHRLNQCDALLLGVLAVITGATGVATEDRELKVALDAALAASSRGKRQAGERAGRWPAGQLALMSFADLRTASPPGSGEAVVCALPPVLRAEEFAGVEADVALFPFAFRSAALWSSRLAWTCRKSAEAAASDLLEHVERFIGSEWFDPFALFERLQSSRARADGVEGTGETRGDLSTRVAQLEEELRALELSGLVRHEALIAAAAQRQKFGR